MLIFKKNSVLLKDLIPEDYVDIHSHLLPGIDDGAKNIEHTNILISQLKSIGIRHFITTPHIINSVWNNTIESIQKTYLTTLPMLENEMGEENIKPAAEYMLDSFFYDLVKNEIPLLTLKENYVLVEMSYLNPPLQLYDFIFELQLAGYKPILAHPERYAFYFNNFKEFYKLKKVGCLFQLNLLSTVGYYGKDVAGISQKLLDNDLYDFVGSDVHHENHIKAFSHRVILKNHQNLRNVIANNVFFKF